MISEKPWSTDAAIRLGLCILATASVGMILAGLFQIDIFKLSADTQQFAQMVLLAVFIDGGALLWIAWFLRGQHVSAREAFGLEPVRLANAAKVGAFAAILFTPVALGLQALSAWLLPHPEAQEVVQILQKADLPLIEKIFMGALAVLFAPVAEEAVFRGIIYPTIKQSGHPRAALWFTSLLFATMHLNAASFLPLALFSMLLIYLYERTGSLLAPIISHSLFNAANFVFLLLAGAPAPPLPAK